MSLGMNDRRIMKHDNEAINFNDVFEKLGRATPNDEFLSTGQVESAIDDLQKALLFLEHDLSNYKWKWLSIALTRALYLLSLNIIRHGHPFASTPHREREPLLKQLEAGEINEGEFSDAIHIAQYKRTISYPDCLKWLAESLYERKAPHLKQITRVTDEELTAATSLREYYRDEFEHMKMDGNTFQVSHLPNKCLLVVRVIRKVCDSGWFFYSVSQELANEGIRTLLDSLDTKLEQEKQSFLNE